ncbi:MAG: hypothetical protein AUI15_24280 [Actinobacteria bacterium 13_2_20CM_2_66_6]|nr:MAG: hypothetical protein AUI15_24280 [Actinobacteria bacterium 13_2_20CM_2_66_6]
MIVDAHLDIGWNAISAGRGFLQPPASGYLVSRPSLVAAEIGLVFATLYTAPARARRSMRTGFVYQNAHEANLMATAQVNYYRSCGLDLIGDRAALAAYARGWKKGRLAGVLLMEGADPIETPSQLGAWTDRGVRIIGPAWGATRYSGGTGAPGGLTELGRQLLKAMRRKQVILDLSHMADQAVADAFGMWRGPATAPAIVGPRDVERRREPHRAPRAVRRRPRACRFGDRPRWWFRREPCADRQPRQAERAACPAPAAFQPGAGRGDHGRQLAHVSGKKSPLSPSGEQSEGAHSASITGSARRVRVRGGD